MVLKVLVKPNSKRGSLFIDNNDGTYTAYVRERPVDGKATLEVIQLIAKHFHIPKTSIHLKLGAQSRTKLFVASI